MRRQPRLRCDHCGQFSTQQSQQLVTLPEHLTQYDGHGVAICERCGTSHKYTNEYWINWLKERGWIARPQLT